MNRNEVSAENLLVEIKNLREKVAELERELARYKKADAELQVKESRFRELYESMQKVNLQIQKLRIDNRNQEQYFQILFWSATPVYLHPALLAHFQKSLHCFSR